MASFVLEHSVVDKIWCVLFVLQSSKSCLSICRHLRTHQTLLIPWRDSLIFDSRWCSLLNLQNLSYDWLFNMQICVVIVCLICKISHMTGCLICRISSYNWLFNVLNLSVLCGASLSVYHFVHSVLFCQRIHFICIELLKIVNTCSLSVFFSVGRLMVMLSGLASNLL